MDALQASALYAALNLIILAVLGLNAGAARTRAKVSLGDGGDQGVICAMRGHANHAEWFPGAMIGLVLMALLNAPVLWIHGLGIAFTLGRGLHAASFITGGGAGPGRTVGALLTLLVYVILAGYLIWASVLS